MDGSNAVAVYCLCAQTELGLEEYTDYIFPDDEQAQSHLKLLQAAQLWKQKKRAREEAENTAEASD